jgi:SAM-dependent methyltransferase
VEHTALESLPRCPLCGSEHRRPYATIPDHSITKERFTVVDCAQCGFRFTDPRPTQSEVGAYYQGGSYISHSNEARSLQDRIYLAARHWSMSRKYALIKAYFPNGRVLDIGCGTGQFLAYLMSRGYLVQGVEPSTEARQQAIADHSFPVVPQLEQVAAQENIQVITMWHVLEHVPDLRATFKRLHSLMADRGLLLIAVPDRGSWDAEHYGTYWAAWDVPRHFSHFRQQDVRILLREHGFTLVRMQRMWLDAYYIALLSERYKGHGSVIAFAKALVIGTVSNLLSLLSDRPASSTLYVARKAEL